jgi:hypothetical protein
LKEPQGFLGVRQVNLGKSSLESSGLFLNEIIPF